MTIRAMIRTAGVLGMGIAVVSGCATTDPQGPFSQLNASIQARTGQTLEWPRSPEARKKRSGRIQALLQDGLTLDQKGVDTDFLLSRSLLSPATCCLVNPDREKTVEKGFRTIQALALRLRQRYGLPEHPSP